MATTMDNLEKLIQMATIEHMYSMLQKMKEHWGEDLGEEQAGYIDATLDIVEDGKLYGLGSNDAGGCLVSLIAVFTYFYNKAESSD